MVSVGDLVRVGGRRRTRVHRLAYVEHRPPAPPFGILACGWAALPDHTEATLDGDDVPWHNVGSLAPATDLDPDAYLTCPQCRAAEDAPWPP